MNAFEYASPETVADAVTLLGADGAAALAGGTDLLNRLKDDVSQARRVVHLHKIKPLGGIAAKDGGLTIGAGTTLAAVVADEKLAGLYPSLRQAALEVGTPQLRNMATVGGNLLQRPRCWYFRSGFGLLGGGKTGADNLVRKGDNRYGAIFLTDGEALFVNPSSLAVPLVALNATATLAGPKGERAVPVAELYRVPKTEAEGELALQAGEVLTAITVPAPSGSNASYEVRQKQSHDWPLALCAAVVNQKDGKVESARIVLGAVAPVPIVAEAASKALIGQALDAQSAEAAAVAAVSDAKPLSKNAYKVALTRVAVKRALLTIAGQRYWEA
jgi:xanthine dehydrogenase YagS FAD-binding subunit